MLTCQFTDINCHGLNCALSVLSVINLLNYKNNSSFITLKQQSLQIHPPPSSSSIKLINDAVLQCNNLWKVDGSTKICVCLSSAIHSKNPIAHLENSRCSIIGIVSLLGSSFTAEPLVHFQRFYSGVLCFLVAGKSVSNFTVFVFISNVKHQISALTYLLWQYMNNERSLKLAIFCESYIS